VPELRITDLGKSLKKGQLRNYIHRQSDQLKPDVYGITPDGLVTEEDHYNQGTNA
jgi:hypothetical protein